LDEAAYEQAKVRVDEFMQKLRNPSNLMSLLK
jgi:hypothetical protein